MIVRVKKFLIFGVKNEISNFFEKAQKAGFIEFIGEEDGKIKKFPASLKKYISAIKILKKQYLEEKKELKKYESKICDEVIQVNNNIEHLKGVKKHILEEIKKASPFGEFSKEDLDFIEEEGKCVFQFFYIKTSRKKKIKTHEDLIYINTEYDLDYFIAINKERKSYKGFIEITFEKPLHVLKKRLSGIEEEIEKQREILKGYAPYLKALKSDLLNRLNFYNLEKTKTFTKASLEEYLFSVEAWVSESKIENMKKLLEDFAIDFEIIKISKRDVVPTCMENNEFARLGEDLVHIYDTPSTKDRDPSFFVLLAFTLFFSMIISDAGYGILYLIIALILKFKVKSKKKAFKRFTKLVFLLSFGCILWGTLTMSFFGLNIKPTSPLQKVSVLNYLAKKKANYHLQKKDDVYKKWKSEYPEIARAKSGEDFLFKAKRVKDKKVRFEAFNEFKNNILLELSLLVGVIHIAISFLRNLKRHLAGIGWVIFMVGGYLFFPSILNATSIIHNILPKEFVFPFGNFLVYIGISLAVVLALLQKRTQGLKEITNVVSVFGDVLSHLRIYALALASMILSETFNDIGTSVPLFIGVFVIVMGHGVNIILSIIGGVIHGLRLNFLEWYRHCFQGGGKLFNPLRLLK
jgi:V/A-type H+-transporting ATPase subunit I